MKKRNALIRQMIWKNAMVIELVEILIFLSFYSFKLSKGLIILLM